MCSVDKTQSTITPHFTAPRCSRTEAVLGAHLAGVEVLVDDGLDDAVHVVVQEVGAGLPDSGDQRVNSLNSTGNNSSGVLTYHSSFLPSKSD